MGAWWIALLVAAVAGDERPWEMLDQSSAWKHLATRQTEIGDVLIYHQRLGEQDCVQGRIHTSVSLAMLEEVVNDSSGEDGRHADLAANEILSEAHNRMDFYQVMDVPNWTMVADRWWLLRAWTETSEAQTLRYRWRRVDAASAYPEVHARVAEQFPGAIELPVNWGEWLFEDKGEERVASYRVCTEMGGSLPKWIQRLAIRRTLPDNIVELVGEARKRSASR